MQTFTVIGLDDETGQVVADHIEAADALSAMIAAAVGRLDADVQIIGAIAGAHQIAVPSEDSGSASYASDLAALAEEGN
jgi:hypothetical protein